MKKYTKIFIILIGLVFSILFFTIFRIGVFRKSESDFIQVINKALVGNKIKVKTTPEIDIDNIKINIAFSEKSVFINGKFLKNIEEAYGGPSFDIYYDNILIGRALHYNTNNWYVNEFIFKFFKEDNQIKFTYIANGKKCGINEGYI